MNKVDLEKVRQARANLKRIKEENPHIRAINEQDLEPILEGKQMSDKDKRQFLYTSKEAAELLGVHVETIRRAIRKGDLRAAKVGHGQRIAGHELVAFFEKRGGGRLFSEEPD